MNEDSIKKPTSDNEDLPDSPRDEKQLQPETVIFDLAEVKDIPGQEHIQTLPLGELADTTISSDDEEGKNVFDDNKNTHSN
ncbi:MAG: hypothetical protein ACR2FN_05510 [Chitinophagaceae bacterium]